MRLRSWRAWTLAGAAWLATPAGAAEHLNSLTAALEQSTAPSSCEGPQYHQLDFWLGDWQVFDTTTHTLVAFDHIEKRLEGCVLQEDLTFLSDLYRRPSTAVRLAGLSISRYDGERWLQMWGDNQWGAIVLQGRAVADRAVEFVSVTPSRGRDVKLRYEPRPDGTVRVLQYVAPAGSAKWQQYGNLEYRHNR